MKLDVRLSAVADLIPQTDTLADIGSDHAYLPVFLLREEIVSRAVITDIRESPLRNSVKNAERAGVSERCSFRLGAGLEPIKAGECEVISICGMGGETIAGILDDGKIVASQTELLVLQPQNNAEMVREKLAALGFGIIEEKMLRDRHLFYNILTAKYGEPMRCIDFALPDAVCFGYSRAYGEYLQYSKKISRGILAQLSSGGGERSEEIRRRENLKLNRIEELLNDYEG